MVDTTFGIIGYSYDPNSKDLHLVGLNRETSTSIQITINNPTQATLMSAMSAYDRRYNTDRFDISLIGNVESMTNQNS